MREATTIHFNMSGVNEDLALGEIMPTPREPTWTEWELWNIMNDEGLFDKMKPHY